MRDSTHGGPYIETMRAPGGRSKLRGVTATVSAEVIVLTAADALKKAPAEPRR